MLQVQQMAQVQQVLLKLASLSVDRCLGRPDSSLSNSEAKCIQRTVGRFIESAGVVMSHLQAKQPGASHGGGGHTMGNSLR